MNGFRDVSTEEMDQVVGGGWIKNFLEKVAVAVVTALTLNQIKKI